MTESMNTRVAVVMDREAEYPIFEGCINMLKEFGVDADIMYCSSQGTSGNAVELVREVEQQGIAVIIAADGKNPGLPDILSGLTALPIISVPVKLQDTEGLDLLLSIFQRTNENPVAAVAVNGSENAALLAVQILSVGIAELREKMKTYKSNLAKTVEEKNKALQEKLG